MSTSIKEKNFVYHEILTDSENIIKDIARLLALGYESDEIIDNSGTVVKPTAPIMDKCWEIVYPKIDRVLFPDIEDWDKLLPDEYKAATDNQISKITDTVILKTKTLPKDIEVNNSTAIGVNQDLNMSSLEMYLEIYMPPYLCDSESEDPIAQRDPEYPIPKVLDINGIKNNNTRAARNYHHLFMRIFDHINEDGTAPAENEIDPVTRDVIKWNSRSSNWSKLSWYTDFEEKFKAPLIGQPELGMQLGTVRVPVIAGLTSESKIKIWANINRSRVAMGVMGSPNIDNSDNRNLVGAAYIGQIDSFDFSVNDTAGNFGLFTTSSTSPAMGKAEIKTRASVPAVKSGQSIVGGTGTIDSGTQFPYMNNLQIFNPGMVYKVKGELIDDIAYDYSKPDGGDFWGSRYIDVNTIKLNCLFNGTPGRVSYTGVDGSNVSKSVGCPRSVSITPDEVVVKEDKKDIEIHLSVEKLLKAFIGENAAEEILQGTGINFSYHGYNGWYNCTLNITYTFSYYTEYPYQLGGVIRDKFGNAVSEELDTTYGKNTANGVTDFAMYATFTKDYFQRHYFMFASAEEYMRKDNYGKSVYTGEYFADRIKVIHNSEGPRGILSGMITIDTSKLNLSDELIINKGFEKYKDQPEEKYIFLPITAPYCPFSNSPNGRHGIGILTDITYPIPTTDEDIVKFAISELKRKYSDLEYVTNNFALLNTSEYGATISWTSSNSTLVKVEGDNAKVIRPEYDESLSDHPSVKMVALVEKGSVSEEFELEIKVKMNVITDSRAVILDLNNIILPESTKVDITLPTIGKNGSTIVWETDDDGLMNIYGQINRPDEGQDDGEVTLTATCTKGIEVQTKEFKIIIPSWTIEEELQQAISLVNWDLIKNKNTNSQAIETDLTFPNKVGRNISAAWRLVSTTADSTSTTGKIDITTGVVTRPTYTQGQVSIQIACELSKSGVNREVLLDPLILSPLAATNEEILTTAKTLLESPVFLGDNASLSKITTGMKLPYRLDDPDANRASITWSLVTVPDHAELVSSPYVTLSHSTDGMNVTITRPSESDGNIQVGLKALIEVGTGDARESDVKYFDMTILKEEGTV